MQPYFNPEVIDKPGEVSGMNIDPLYDRFRARPILRKETTATGAD
jgi:hypothetical protein